MSSVEAITIPRVMLVGASHSAGTSTLVLGLVVKLRKQEIAAGTVKIGPSLIEGTHHRRILGRLSFTLDPWMLSPAQCVDVMERIASGTEIALVEGDGGLFDWMGERSAYPSQAELAAALKIPIVLVIDAYHLNESISALVLGYASFVEQQALAGVIATRVRDTRHEERLRRSIEALGGPLFLGAVPIGDARQTGGTLAGLQIYNPSLLTRNRVNGAGTLVEAIDIETLRRIAESAPPLDRESGPVVSLRTVKIAVADDQAFHLMFQDNLDMLRREGVELAAFSPIADRRLPSGISAIYLPGGYPHLYSADLQANSGMLQSLREFAASGGIIYAEAGGLAYLCRTLVGWNGTPYTMAGVIPGVASAVVEDSKPSEIIFEELRAVESSIVSPVGMRARGIRDTRWAIRLDEPVTTCFATRERGRKTAAPTPDQPLLTDGFSPSENVLVTRMNLHWGSNPEIARWLVQTAQRAPVWKSGSGVQKTAPERGAAPA